MTSSGTPSQGQNEVLDSTATRRSWYLSAAAADALAATVEDLHYELRVPKHHVLTAVIRAGLAHPDEVRDRISNPARYAPPTDQQ